MTTSRVWEWDVRRTDEEIRKILKNPEHPSYLHYASLLLARHNVPKEVFSRYLKKEDFCMQWQNIKRRMRKDRRDYGRIQFWQEIYRHLSEKLKSQGIALRRPAVQVVQNSLRARIGKRVREVRCSKKITQADLARGAGLTQQFVSRIERGTENVSLDTIERIQKYIGEDLFCT